MKKFLHPKFLPVLVAVSGLLGLVLRLWTMGSGPNKEGLYEPQPLAWALLWIVTIAVLAAIVLLSARLKNPGRYFDNYPPSRIGAVGCALAALGIMISALTTIISAPDLLASVTGILGVVSAMALLLTGFARYSGKKPSFALHAIACLFFALRIFQCCNNWSNMPQISVFLFQFLASICIMLATYQLTCFDVNLGKRRTSLFWSLSSVYFCCLSIPSGEEPMLYVGMAIWLLTNLCSLRPIKARKPQPAPQEAPETQPEPAAPAPEASVSAADPALQEDMSLDELMKWLDKE